MDKYQYHLLEYLINFINESRIDKISPPIKVSELTDADILISWIETAYHFYHHKSGLYWGIKIPHDPTYKLINIFPISLLKTLDDEFLDLIDEHTMTWKISEEIKNYIKILTI
jgi:hypothetical protein